MAGASTVTRPGQLLGQRYRPVRSLGVGGQAEVMLAVDVVTGHHVALKRRLASEVEDPKTRELFERECCVLERLEHPSLPRVFGHFEYEGDLYLVLEFIEGESLQSLLAQHRSFTEPSLWRMLRELGDVLAFLHGQQPPVVHRDIKPSNILRRPDGRHVLIDFGLVRDRQRGASASTYGGTLGFMPPEQALGQALPQTDLYALGMTALVLASGKSPDRLTFVGLRVQIPSDLPISPDLRRLLERLLEPEPHQRPNSIAEATKPPPAPSPTSPTATLPAERQRAGWATGIASLLALLALGWGFSRSFPAGREATRASGPGEAERSETRPPTAVTTPSVSSPAPVPTSPAGAEATPVLRAPTVVPVEPVTPAASISSAPVLSVPLEDACARWLRESAKGQWSADLVPALGSSAGLAERITRKKLRLADLTLSASDIPCSDRSEARSTFATAVCQSAGAWSLVDEPSSFVIEAVKNSADGLTPAAGRALEQRLAARLAPLLAKAQRPSDLEPARTICELEGRLGRSPSTACAGLERRYQALVTAEAQLQQRCQQASEGHGQCSVDCTFRFDLFDPRMRQCDQQCLATYRRPGCPALKPLPD